MFVLKKGLYDEPKLRPRSRVSRMRLRWAPEWCDEDMLGMPSTEGTLTRRKRDSLGGS